MKEFKIWLLYTKNSFQQTLTNRFLMVVLMLGKIIRIVLFLLFLNFLFSGARDLAGYNREQIIFFYLSFNLVDTLGQLFYREVYRFRPLVISGNLDFVLLKPVNPLVRVLMGGGDVMDFLMLIFIIIFTFYFGWTNITQNLWAWVGYVVLIVNGLILSTSFYIMVLGIGVVTTAIDHLVMVYRDLTSMLRIPVDLYVEPIRALLTFIIPLGIMITFPAKSLMGILSWPLFAISLSLALISLYLSLRFWSWSLKRYTSGGS